MPRPPRGDSLVPNTAAAVCDLPAPARHRVITFAMCAARDAAQPGPGPDWRTSEAQSRELDETDVKPPKNVGDIELTDSADRAASATSHNVLLELLVTRRVGVERLSGWPSQVFLLAYGTW